jgi:hypothetical protein
VERTTIAGETEELGENLPQRHFVPPQNRRLAQSVSCKQPVFKSITEFHDSECRSVAKLKLYNVRIAHAMEYLPQISGYSHFYRHKPLSSGPQSISLRPFIVTRFGCNQILSLIVPFHYAPTFVRPGVDLLPFCCATQFCGEAPLCIIP